MVEDVLQSFGHVTPDGAGPAACALLVEANPNESERVRRDHEGRRVHQEHRLDLHHSEHQPGQQRPGHRGPRRAGLDPAVGCDQVLVADQAGDGGELSGFEEDGQR